MAAMIDISDHNKHECIQRLNLIIPEIPFIKSFADDCLLERLLNLISLITTAFDESNRESTDLDELYSEAERESAIRSWLQRHYTDNTMIDGFEFSSAEDRTRITVLIINILYKLRHSLKDIEQYLEDCQSFVEFDQKLNPITRFDRLLELLQNDCNRWRSEARYYKVKYDESKKLIDKYQQNEIFNYNCYPRNQNIYKSRMTEKTTEVEDVCKNMPKEAIVTGVEVKVKVEADETESKVSESELNDEDEDESQDTLSSLDQLSVSLSESVDDKAEVKEADLTCFPCQECVIDFESVYELNLHLLKDHANINVDFPEDTQSSNDCHSSIPTLPSTEPKKFTKTEISFKKPFKCLFNECGTSFKRFFALKKHFQTHRLPFNRLMSHIYRDCVTEAVLNRVRTLPDHKLEELRFKPQIMSHSERSKHFMISTGGKHKKAIFNSYVRRMNTDPKAREVNGSNRLYINQLYNYRLTNGSNGRSHNGSPVNSLLAYNHNHNYNNYRSAKTVPIVSTPDIFTQWDDEVMDIEGMEINSRLYFEANRNRNQSPLM